MNKIIFSLVLAVSPAAAGATSLLHAPWIEKVIFEGTSVGDGLVQNQGASVPCGIVLAKYADPFRREVLMTGRMMPWGFLTDSLNMWAKIEDIVRSTPSGEVVIDQEDKGFRRKSIRYLGPNRSEVWIEYTEQDNPRNPYGSKREVFIIEFSGSAIVRYEVRSYPGPNDLRPGVWSTYYQVYPSRLQRDADGQGFYMGFRCQNAVTS